jgi:hypothetical protein
MERGRTMKTHPIFGALLGAVLALVGPLPAEGQNTFTLHGNEQLTVNTAYVQGDLHDMSRVSIVGGGSVNYITAYDSSAVDISGGKVYHVSGLLNSSTVDISSGELWYDLNAYDSSTVNISGGNVGLDGGTLYAVSTSTIHISGGLVRAFYAYNTSMVDISGGTVGNGYTNHYAYHTSTVDISGGSVDNLYARDTSTVDISGGSVRGGLFASDTTAVTFHARDFSLGSGLSLDGDRVLGTGLLSGEWFDGTLWTANIEANGSGATILAVPEPATVALLALGGLTLLRRRRARE